jgi:uncharacterized protein (TIGR03084 family)
MVERAPRTKACQARRSGACHAVVEEGGIRVAEPFDGQSERESFDPNVAEVLDALGAEWAVLDEIVADAGDALLDQPTLAPGWSVRDTLGHLAWFDEAAARAVVDPAGFEQEAAAARERRADPVSEHLARARGLEADALRSWWRTARVRLAEALSSLDPGRRVPWYGPPMRATTFAIARLMEAWAHGLDVAEALGAPVARSNRLRYVAHLGVLTRGFSYAVRGLPPPEGTVAVVLEGPSGERWVWDARGGQPGGTTGTVQGSALDFCLVVTQRRHLADTELDATGSGLEWLHIAQAFAGPPGIGRPAGLGRPRTR